MNIQKLIVPEIRLNLLDKLQETQSISQIRDISEEVLGTKTTQHKPWISTNTWALIEERKNMRLKLLTDPLNNNLTQCHKSICQNIKKSARNDKRAYYNGIADEAEKAAEMNYTRMLYSCIKQQQRDQEAAFNKGQGWTNNYNKRRPTAAMGGIL